MPSVHSALAGLAALALVALPATVSAHHTFVSKYDSGKQIKLSGTITAVRYANPHIFFEMDAGGTVWTIETEGILAAQKAGLTEAALATGAKVTVSGWPARDKATELGLKAITFQNGKTVTMRKSAR